MATRTLEIDLKDLPEFFRQRGRRMRTPDLRKPLGAAAVALAASTKENFDGGHDPDGVPWKPLAHPRVNSKGSDKPLRDKGLLMASVSARGAKGHIERIGRQELQFGTNLIYARLHQEGGVIRPKNGKYLAIPLTREAQRAVSPRRFAGSLFTIKSKKGNLLLAERSGGGIKPQYALLKQVHIPARPFLGLNQKTIDIISRIFAEYVANLAA